MYQTITTIGKGGFSEVYHCVCLKEAKNYAMKKVFLKDLDSDSIKLVMNEIDLLKKLQSTNKVVHLID